MSFFANTSHVKYVEEVNAIRLSLRSSEEQVEEFLLPLQDVYIFVSSNPDLYEKWWGEGCIQGRRNDKNGYVRIQVDFNRRSIYKMPRSTFDLLLAQVRAEVSKGDLEGARLIFSQVRPILDTSEIKNVLDEKIDLEVFKNELLNQFDILITSRLKDLPTQTIVTTQQTSSPSYKVDTPESVFIPTDLGKSEMKGKIEVKKSKGESSSLEEAAKLLKQSKKGRAK
jgi:hypothetical protein